MSGNSTQFFYLTEFRSNHLPRTIRIKNIKPLNTSSKVIVAHTPITPYRFVKIIIGKTRIPHMLNAFRTKGHLLSPAPRKAPYTTILIANNGSEKETILKHSLAPSITS